MKFADRLKQSQRALPKRSFTLRPELLCLPTVPEPMHGVAPRVVLGATWWNLVRKTAYAKTNYHCLACGIHKSKALGHKWMEGHEVYEIDYRKCRMVYVETVPMCHYCHNYIHIGRLNSLLQKGQIPQVKYTAIVRHGDRILLAAGLQKPTQREEITANWSKWRLVVNGEEYPPLFKSEEEWRTHYDAKTS